jgi:hypothetical protein
VREISAGRNISSGTNKLLMGRDKPPKICHSRRGSFLIARQKLGTFPSIVLSVTIKSLSLEGRGLR